MIQLPNIRYQLKSVAPFFVLMILISIIGMSGPVFTRWAFAPNVIVMYHFAFSIYYIYIAANSPYNDEEDIQSGTLFSLSKKMLENRLFPFFVIYLTSIISSMVLRASRGQFFPANFALFLDDREVAAVLYFMYLYHVLRYGKRPFIIIPLLFAVSYLTYFFSNLFFSAFPAGDVVVAFKIIVVGLVLFFVTWGIQKKPILILRNLIVSLAVSAILMEGLIQFYSWSFLRQKSPVVRVEYGLRLVHYGRSNVLRDLADIAFLEKDPEVLKRIYPLFQYYKIPVNVSDQNWIDMLKSGDLTTANQVALYMLKEGVRIEFKSVIALILENGYENQQELVGCDNLVRLAAQSVASTDENKELLKMVDKYSASFDIWALKVLGESGDCDVVDDLIGFLSEFDSDISFAAYRSLRLITGLKPVQDLGIPYNSVSAMEYFKEYYLDRCTTD